MIYLIDEFFDVIEIFFVLAYQRLRRNLGESSGHQTDEMRCPSSEDRNHLVRLHADIESLEIMRYGGDVEVRVRYIGVLRLIPGQEGADRRDLVDTAFLEG